MFRMREQVFRYAGTLMWNILQFFCRASREQMSVAARIVATALCIATLATAEVLLGGKKMTEGQALDAEQVPPRSAARLPTVPADAHECGRRAHCRTSPTPRWSRA